MARETYAGSQWGVLVQAMNQQQDVLFQHQATNFFTPASNNKILSTAPAFQRLGPDHRITTQVKAGQTVPDDSAEHDASSAVQLCITGSGDPSMQFSDLQSIARQVAAALGKVNVRIGLDSSRFVGFPGSWEWEDLSAYYGAQPVSFVLQENTVTLSVKPGSTVGAPVQVSFTQPWAADAVTVAVDAVTGPCDGTSARVYAGYSVRNTSELLVSGVVPVCAQGTTVTVTASVLDPTAYFAAGISAALRETGVVVDGMDLTADCSSASLKPIVTHQSAPLAALMTHCLKVSDNLYAEFFLRYMGFTFHNVSRSQTQGDWLAGGIGATTSVAPGSYQHALAVDRVLLTTPPFNVSGALFHRMDGSGLSRRNAVSPASLVQTLHGLLSPSGASLYRDMLPIGGVDGTLKHRFPPGTAGYTRVFAKTGTVARVNALSGIVYPLGLPIPSADGTKAYTYMSQHVDRDIGGETATESHTATGYPYPVLVSVINNQSPVSSSQVRKGIDDMVNLVAELKNC